MANVGVGGAGGGGGAEAPPAYDSNFKVNDTVQCRISGVIISFFPEKDKKLAAEEFGNYAIPTFTSDISIQADPLDLLYLKI